MKFERLVAYGCSHTAGAETQDEDYIPNADSIKKEIGMSKFLVEYSNVFNKNIDEYIDAGKKKSYIRHLADSINLPYDNRAIPGSSLAHQIYSIEQDLADNNIKNSDLIIIGITGKDRLLAFEGDDPKTILLSHPHTYPEFISQYEKSFLNYFSDQIITFQNLMLFQYLLNLANERLKNQLYFVFCDSWVQNLNYHWTGMTELPTNFKSAMQRLQDEFVNSKFILSQTNIYHDSNLEELHGGKHLKEVAHKRFANLLYHNLISKNIL